MNSIAKRGDSFLAGAIGEVKTAVAADIDSVVGEAKHEVEKTVDAVALEIKSVGETELAEVKSRSNSVTSAGGEILAVSGEKTRSRKLDRKALHSDLVAELPLSIRYGYNTVGDDDSPHNYVNDWQGWSAGGVDRLEELLKAIDLSVGAFDMKSNFNVKCAKSIQFCLLVLGSSIVYVQASGASTSVIANWNIVGGALTTACTMVYNFFNFGKRGPHFARIVTNLRLLKGWIQSKIVLPVEHRFSPYDIFMIANKAYETILQEAEQGDKAATNSN